MILDAHESQGFAIQEALFAIPFVWNVSSMSQEEGARYQPIPATSIPYWDNSCRIFLQKNNLKINIMSL